MHHSGGPMRQIRLPDRDTGQTVKTGRRLMQMSRLFAFLGQAFFARFLCLLTGSNCTKTVQNRKKSFRFNSLWHVSTALAGLIWASSGQAAAVQGQAILNTASLHFSQSVVPVVSSVSVTFIRRTRATIGFKQFSPVSGMGTATSVNPSACRSGNGTWTTVNSFQPLGGAAINLPATPAILTTTAYKTGSPIFVEVNDPDQNLNLAALDTVVVTLTAAGSLDQETLRLTETGVNTGRFVGVIMSAPPPATVQDCMLSVQKNQTLTARYTDTQDATDIVAASVLVDPVGMVFDSATGAAVDGASVTLWDVANDAPAVVKGDDGVSAFPSTLVSGGTATDASGQVYNFSPGQFRFPFVAPGQYQFRVTPPAQYAFPSQVNDTTLQSLNGAPFALTTGSRGETFTISPGPVVHIDLPVDTNSLTLLVEGQVNPTTAAQGDLVTYQLNIKNPNRTAATANVEIRHQLPEGFRYRHGSALLDGKRIVPVISADGRTLTFRPGGSIPAQGLIQLEFVVEVTSNAIRGERIATLMASGLQGSNPVQSQPTSIIVTIRPDLFAEKNILMGRVFFDGMLDETGQLLQDDQGNAGNGLNDAGEKGLANARIYLEDGRFVVTDEHGFYHFEDVRPGTHVVQLDRSSLPQGVIPRGLENNRFAGSDTSRFVDLQPGTLWRTNFRVLRQLPPKVPVRISQNASLFDAQRNLVKIHLHIETHPAAALTSLQAVYLPPVGWELQEGFERLDGQPAKPQVNEREWIWSLDPAIRQHEIEFVIHNGGKIGRKKARAQVRYVSYGRQTGKTSMAEAEWLEVEKRVMRPRTFRLYTHFDEVQATLKPEDRVRLDQLIEKLKDIHVNKLVVTGYTDNLPIRRKWWQLFRTNRALSHARAEEVARYLKTRLGLQPEQIEVHGRGARDPLTSNATAEGRAKNRRAEILVLGNQTLISKNIKLTQTAGQGEGLANQAVPEDSSGTVEDKNETPEKEGILSPGEQQTLPFDIVAVRVQLDSRLKPVLSVDGEDVPEKRIGFRSANSETGKTLYTYLGVRLAGAGQHVLTLKGMGPFGNVRFEQSIHVNRSGEIHSLEQVAAGSNVADGKTPIRIRIEVKDRKGRQVHAETDLEIRKGTLKPPVKLQPTRLVEAQHDQQVSVDAEGWVTFAPVTQSGRYQATLAYGDVETEVETFVRPAYRDLIMVGLAEGTLGYQQIHGHMQSLPDDQDREGWVQDGRIAFYAKGKVKGKWLLTAAYDTAKTKGRTGDRLLQTVQPDAFYTIYGDGTSQSFDAPSQRKLYLKLERDTFYALFGDYATDLSVTELSRYTRTLNGIKSEWAGQKGGYRAFAALTGQTLVHDEIRGDGTSGLYHLSRQDLLANSEKVVIETRDRFRSEQILEQRTLSRFIDYDVDYLKGTLFFKQPVVSRDSRFNPVYIIVDYETRRISKPDLTVVGGRGYLRPARHVEVGLTAIQQEQAAGDEQMLGTDIQYRLNRNTTLQGEFSGTDTVSSGKNNAWRVAADFKGEHVRGQAYYRNVENGFGLGQISQTENGTRKYGLDANVTVSDPLKVDTRIYRQTTQSTHASRDVLDLSGHYTLKRGEFRLGALTARDHLQNGTQTSNNLTAGASWKVTDRVRLHLDHEQNLTQNNSVDFPTRSRLGLDYAWSSAAMLFAEQEWTRGQNLDANLSRLGVRGTPWNGAQLSSSVESRVGENGERAFANIGLNQTWSLNELWSMDVGLDRTQTLKDDQAADLQPNPAVPLVTGGTEDFTAVSAGVSYRPSHWEWDNRLERRVASSERRWGISSGLLGEINDSLTASGRVQGFSTHGTTNLSDEANLRLGAAWRPHRDGWMMLNRFEARYLRSETGTTDQKDLRFINNLNSHHQLDANDQLAWQVGLKYTRNTLSRQTYHTVLDLLGLEWAHDLSEKWDLHLHARRLHSLHASTSQYHTGLSLGRQLVERMWVSAGYNFSGFYDADFSSSDFTAQGPFVKLRLKLDQNDLRRWLEH
ncbi:MAG: hypothetical protein D6698_12735 [Gammaproteobacteria bacterium]|nr:MAG: hypothetical protein D6698_12735 [Gammaproteobacteria bacterium]